MKATGIVRRIDDLGRVVIPKEIRRTMRIREGDPLQMTLERWEKFCFAMLAFSKRWGGWYIIMKSCVSWGTSLCPSAWRASRRPMTAAGVRDMMHRKAVPYRAKVQE